MGTSFTCPNAEAADRELAVDQGHEQRVALEGHGPRDDDLGEEVVGAVLVLYDGCATRGDTKEGISRYVYPTPTFRH